MAKKVKRGAPTKYQKALGNLIAKMVSDGATFEEIAKAAGIDVGTLWNWRNTQEDIKKAVRDAKNIPNQLVEGALFKLCVGYSVTTKDADGNEKVFTHVKPDITAIKHWLKNRDPENWAEESKLELEMTKPIRLDLSNASEEELMDAIMKEVRADKKVT